jgi:hypothetical protein
MVPTARLKSGYMPKKALAFFGEPAQKMDYLVMQCTLETAITTAPQVDGVVIPFPSGDALCVSRTLTDECDAINDETQDTNL